MEGTEFPIALGRLPTLVVGTAIDFLLLRFVKSEVETFAGVDFATYCLLEIFVGDNTIFVEVKFIENRHELLIWEGNTPMLEIELEFVFWNVSSLFKVQVLESLSKGLPLEFDFLNDCFFNVLINQIDLSLSFIIVSQILLVFPLIIFKHYVLDTIVPKVETLWQVDAISKPLRKVCVPNLPNFFGILIHYKFLEVIVINVSICPKVPHDIFDSYISVIVLIKGQESFPHTLETRLELKFYLPLKHLDSVLDYLGMLIFIIFQFSLVCLVFPFVVWVVLLFNDVEVRKESLFKSVKIDTLVRY